MRLILSLCLICCVAFSAYLCLTIVNANQDPLVVERATEDEARQVQTVADTFERKMRETRDVSSLKDLFLHDYMRLQIEAERASNPGQPVFLIPSMPLSIESDLAARITQRDWERFYTARLNLRYYFVLLIASRLRPDDFKHATYKQKLFPVEVLTLLKSDPFLRGEYSVEGDHKKYKIETLEEFQSLVTTLEKATLVLRQQFLKHPPEETRIYQENLRSAPPEQKARNNQLIWPHIYGTEQSRFGFPRGTRFFNRLTADSLFELSFVKTESGIKIVWAQVYPFN